MTRKTAALVLTGIIGVIGLAVISWVLSGDPISLN
jgi:hypothetical protein